jgi:hypothetical protein
MLDFALFMLTQTFRATVATNASCDRELSMCSRAAHRRSSVSCATSSASSALPKNCCPMRKAVGRSGVT